MIFATILAGLSQSLLYDAVYLGIHAGDHAIYPDCRPEFKTRLNEAIIAATEGEVLLLAPFINMTKGAIVCEGKKIGAPFELTRTCYKNQELPCGVCGSCIERIEAFQANGMIDPVEYAK